MPRIGPIVALTVTLLAVFAASARAQQSTTGITLTYDELQSLPLGRNVSEVLVLAPGVDVSGIQVPTIFRSPFLTFYADGLPASSVLPVEFAQNAVVETGGIPVEYQGSGGVIDVTFRNGRQHPRATLFGYTTPSGLQTDYDHITGVGRQLLVSNTSDFGATFGTSSERLSFFGGVDRFQYHVRSETPPGQYVSHSSTTAYLARLSAQATTHWTITGELLGDPGSNGSEFESSPGPTRFQSDFGVHRGALRATRTTGGWLVDAAIGHGVFHTNGALEASDNVLRLALQHAFGGTQTVHFGGEVQRRADRRNFADNSSARLHEDLTALWLADAWQLHEAVILTGGVRWWRLGTDQHTAGGMDDARFVQRQNEADPRLSLAWTPVPDTRVTASVNRYSGQRLFGSYDPAVGQPVISPDDVTETIVRVERTLGAWRVGGFAIDQQHVDFRAVVAEAAYRGTGGLRVHGSFLAGNRGMLFAARQQFEADAAYGFPAGAAHLDLGTVLTASTGSNSASGLRRKTAARLDLHGGVAFRAGATAPRFVVDIFNVTNNDRVIATSTTFEGTDQPLVWQAPRSIRLGLRLGF
jgi:hypothetical protein